MTEQWYHLSLSLRNEAMRLARRAKANGKDPSLVAAYVFDARQANLSALHYRKEMNKPKKCVRKQ